MRVESLQSRAIRVLIALLLTAAPCPAQSSASLEVIVKDPTGALISKAQVQLFKNGKPQSLGSTNQRGEARFNKLAAGSYQVHIEAAGFKALDLTAVDLTTDPHRREVTLEIDVIKVDVDVEEEARVRNTNPNGPAFSNVLTADQIAQLPDDPDEFENAINQLAGPGATIRVDGFRGGKLPPKSQIRGIRFSSAMFGAENHSAGHTFVDIATQPGLGPMRGSMDFTFRDESLNARNA